MSRTKRTRTVPVRNRVKLHDVADLAGVSAQTVSRVVRNSPGVAAETREKVMAAVAQLGYRPNLAARSLSAGRIGSVHVVVAATLYHGTAQAFVAICEALGEMGLATSTSIAGDESDAARIVPVTADAVIVLGGMSAPEPWLGPIVARVPVVYVGRVGELPEGVSGVMVDQLTGAELAVAHLVKRGAKKIAHIAGPEGWLDAQVRLQGFREAAEAFGVEHLVYEAGTWEGADAMRVAATMDDDIDGVFAANDNLALGYMSHCHRIGRRIPDDVAVIGVDDTSGADSYPPPLTTVSQLFPQMGRIAVERISKMLAGGGAEHILLQPELIIRESA